MEVCLVGSIFGYTVIAGDVGQSLSEERKEQLEKLPHPLTILDPPFAPGELYPAGVGVGVIQILYAF